jgi:hypothetical protein
MTSGGFLIAVRNNQGILQIERSAQHCSIVPKKKSANPPIFNYKLSIQLSILILHVLSPIKIVIH